MIMTSGPEGGVVIVDKEGKVAFVQVQESTGDERNFSEIQDALTKLG